MQDIYSWIKSEEAKFETDEIQVGDNFHWNFRKHVQLIFHLVNGVFYTGDNNWLRAFKNIMEPILNLSFWTEDIEVKDVTFYIEEQDSRALSFLIKKYHDEVYVKEHDLDTMFDEITESDLTYGGVLVQKGVDRPEILPLNSVAFGDQTDILGGPMGFKFFFTPSKLRSMSKFGWGNTKNGATISLEDLCVLAENTKDSIGTLGKKQNQVPGKSLEVYIVRGNMPETYLQEDGDEEYQCNQIQIVAFYVKKDGNKQGVTLYRKKEDEGNLKFFTSKKIYQRALGRGVGEGLLHPQIWTNFLTIHKMNMLEAASKVPLYTDDDTYANKNKIQDMENLEITTIGEGKRILQVPTAAPGNIQLIQASINDWYQYGQLEGSAFDSIMGKQESSGTTFRGQNQLVQQGRGIHDRRRGQRAKFIEEIYRDFIIPDIVKEITKDKEFMATLSTDELTWVADQLATTATNQRIKDMIFKNKMPSPQDQQTFTSLFKQDFFKKGNKHLLKILKGDFKNISEKIGINIAAKQKNLGNLSDKILSIFQFIIANPQAFQQAMQIPALANSFGDILEYGGLSMADFSSLLQPAPIPQGIPPINPNQAQPKPVRTPQLGLTQNA